MVRSIPLMFLFLIAMSSSLQAQSTFAGTKFLAQGAVYEIDFATTVDRINGQPFEPRARQRLFRIASFGPASWVRLEHPRDVDDLYKWNRKLFAEKLLATEDAVAKIESHEAGKQVLERFRKEAAVEIKLTTTRVNLAHAVSISEISLHKFLAGFEDFIEENPPEDSSE